MQSVKVENKLGCGLMQGDYPKEEGLEFLSYIRPGIKVMKVQDCSSCVWQMHVQSQYNFPILKFSPIHLNYIMPNFLPSLDSAFYLRESINTMVSLCCSVGHMTMEWFSLQKEHPGAGNGWS